MRRRRERGRRRRGGLFVLGAAALRCIHPAQHARLKVDMSRGDLETTRRVRAVVPQPVHARDCGTSSRSIPLEAARNGAARSSQYLDRLACCARLLRSSAREGDGGRTIPRDESRSPSPSRSYRRSLALCHAHPAARASVCACTASGARACRAASGGRKLERRAEPRASGEQRELAQRPLVDSGAKRDVFLAASDLGDVARERGGRSARSISSPSLARGMCCTLSLSARSRPSR